MQKVDRTLTAEEIRDLVGTSPLMLEIGCHDGSDTVKFLAAMPGMQLHCFEPYQPPIVRFKKTIGDDHRVILLEKAVAEIDGKSAFNPSTGKAGGKEDWDYSGSLEKPTGHLNRSPEIKFKPPIIVPSIRLDTWLAELVAWEERVSPVDFIWADVQGAQRRLIAGGRLALAVTRYLYIECHHEPLYEGEPTQVELIAQLPGFEPLAVYDQDNILFKNRHFA